MRSPPLAPTSRVRTMTSESASIVAVEASPAKLQSSPRGHSAHPFASKLPAPPKTGDEILDGDLAARHLMLQEILSTCLYDGTSTVRSPTEATGDEAFKPFSTFKGLELDFSVQYILHNSDLKIDDIMPGASTRTRRTFSSVTTPSSPRRCECRRLVWRSPSWSGSWRSGAWRAVRRALVVSQRSKRLEGSSGMARSTGRSAGAMCRSLTLPACLYLAYICDAVLRRPDSGDEQPGHQEIRLGIQPFGLPRVLRVQADAPVPSPPSVQGLYDRALPRTATHFGQQVLGDLGGELQ